MKIGIILCMFITLFLLCGCVTKVTNHSNNDENEVKSDYCFADSDCFGNKVCYSNKCVDLSPKIQCEKAGQFWCGENGPCHGDFVGHCMDCLGKQMEMCTCLTESEEQKEDGSECFTPRFPGKCNGGICIEETPWTTPKGNIKIGIIEFQRDDTAFPCYKRGEYNLETSECKGNVEYSFLELLHNTKGYTEVEFRNGGEEETVHSLYYIGNWYEQQAQKYGVNFDINLEIHGPLTIPTEPPVRARHDTCEVDGFFEKYAKNKGIDIESYDIVVFVYLNDYKVGPRLVSCYNSPKTVYIDTPVLIEEAREERLIKDILHELGHAFGAIDHYEQQQDGLGCDEGGIPDEPSKACIMCGLCPDNKCGLFLNGENPLVSQTTICDETAKRFEWLS